MGRKKKYINIFGSFMDPFIYCQKIRDLVQLNMISQELIDSERD